MLNYSCNKITIFTCNLNSTHITLLVSMNFKISYGYACCPHHNSIVSGKVHFRARLPQRADKQQTEEVQKQESCLHKQVDNCSIKWWQAKAVEPPLLLVVLTAISLKILKLAGDQSCSVSTIQNPPAPPPHGEHPSPPHPAMQQYHLSQQTWIM